MGGVTYFNPQILTLVVVTTTTILFLITPSIVNGALEHDTVASSSSHPFISNNHHSSPFRPSTGVLVGALTATLSIFFLLLLYIKHCSRTVNVNPNSQTLQRKNSGIDPSVLELLPLFRFKSLEGEKNGLECAVCLAKFEDPEVLRLLPKCKHAFHGDCLDTWLGTHSTCPLCRSKVNIEDIAVVDEEEKCSEGESDIESGQNDDASRRGKESENSRMSTSTGRSIDGAEHRLEHRIIVSPSCSGSSGTAVHQQWSDFQRDVLYLTPDMITWKARGGRARKSHNIVVNNNSNSNVGVENSREMKNLRTVSDATGLHS